MKKQKIQKNRIPSNKGITLIALVITIIVMLILVAVTISMAVNGGLFEYAGKATGETQNAIDAEQSLANGRVNVNGVWYDDIDAYLNNIPSEIQDEESNTITFTLGSETFTVEEGTTWETWVTSSNYDSGDWEIAEDGKIVQRNDKVYRL